MSTHEGHHHVTYSKFRSRVSGFEVHFAIGSVLLSRTEVRTADRDVISGPSLRIIARLSRTFHCVTKMHDPEGWASVRRAPTGPLHGWRAASATIRLPAEVAQRCFLTLRVFRSG
jgi:hypothetical protein